MNVIPFVHEGLGNSSYLVGLDASRAVLVDPDRTIARYLQAAEARGWRVDAVLETHLHADFVSGAREVAAATGARIFTPAGSEVRFPHHGVRAGERISLDGVEAEAIASAGHTPEHLAYALRSGARLPALFSGGSLIVMGAARTDLVAPELTEPLTRAQFRTLRTAFSALPDETALYPTHGGGSFCTAGGSDQRTSTLGEQRALNPLLAMDDEDDFARWFPTTFPNVPDYYWRMRDFNQRGPRLRAEIAMPRPLSPSEFDALRHQALIVDVRDRKAYARGHITGSLSIPFREAFAVWLGWLTPAEAALLFVAGGEDIAAVADEALLVGYEHFCGFLEGGIDAWREAGHPLRSVALVDAAAARDAVRDGALVLDVREPDEYASGHVEGARHVPLGKLEAVAHELPKRTPIVAYCGHGDRAASAVSILERAGLGPLFSLDGGIDAWREAGSAVS